MNIELIYFNFVASVDEFFFFTISLLCLTSSPRTRAEGILLNINRKIITNLYSNFRRITMLNAAINVNILVEFSLPKKFHVCLEVMWKLYRGHFICFSSLDLFCNFFVFFFCKFLLYNKKNNHLFDKTEAVLKFNARKIIFFTHMKELFLYLKFCLPSKILKYFNYNDNKTAFKCSWNVIKILLLQKIYLKKTYVALNI